jgi:hypothetical protein
MTRDLTAHIVPGLPNIALVREGDGPSAKWWRVFAAVDGWARRSEIRPVKARREHYEHPDHVWGFYGNSWLATACYGLPADRVVVSR